jgi:hypothetical protein
VIEKAVKSEQIICSLQTPSSHLPCRSSAVYSSHAGAGRLLGGGISSRQGASFDGGWAGG